jgi:hypothetical protein
MTVSEFVQQLIDDGVCGGKIYHLKAPNGTSYPYCVYDYIENSLSEEMEGSKGSRYRILFTSWHESIADAETVKAAFRSSVLTNQMGRMESGAVIDIDPTTEKYRLTNNDWALINP